MKMKWWGWTALGLVTIRIILLSVDSNPPTTLVPQDVYAMFYCWMLWWSAWR